MRSLIIAALLAGASICASAQTGMTVTVPAKARAGEKFRMEVSVRNGRGLPVETSNGPVTMSARKRGLAAEGTLAVTSAVLDRGRAVIAEQSFTRAGVIRISAADYNGLAGESVPFDILPNDPAKLSLAQEKTETGMLAVATVMDTYSNPVKGLRVDFSAMGKFLANPRWAFTDEQGRASCEVYGSGTARISASAAQLSASAGIEASAEPAANQQRFAETATASEEPAVSEISLAQAEREQDKKTQTVAPVTDFISPDLMAPQKQETEEAPVLSTQAAPAPVAEPPVQGASVKILKHVLAADVRGKQPWHENPGLHGQAQAVFWNQAVSDSVPFALTHRWILNGKIMAEIKAVLTVSPARTWSRKTLRPGEWTVLALDDSGRVLAKTDFTVAP